MNPYEQVVKAMTEARSKSPFLYWDRIETSLTMTKMAAVFLPPGSRPPSWQDDADDVVTMDARLMGIPVYAERSDLAPNTLALIPHEGDPVIVVLTT